MKAYSVIIEHIVSSLNRPFFYFHEDDFPLYSRVSITFNNQDIVGFIIDKEEVDDIESFQNQKGIKISYINSLIDQEPLISEEKFCLAKRIASYYFVPLISVIFSMLPPSLKPSKTALSKAKISYETYVEALPGATYDDLTTRQAEVFYKLSQGPVLKKDLSRSIVTKLLALNKVRLVNKEKNRFHLEKEKYVLHKLNEEQQKAYDEFILTSDKVYLLQGVTGSGKTEIYLYLSQYYLSKGKQVLVLVPEITLSYQMVARFHSLFDKVGVLHSSLSDGERYDVYRDIKRGKYDIVIGTRSAIFAPLDNLELIIIDEEHSQTYKQEDSLPYYDSRKVAKMIFENKEGKILLSSATPSLDSRARAFKNIYHHLVLTKRVKDIILPKVEIVDLLDYHNINKESIIISLPLRKEIENTLNNNEQVILLVNRRGFASSVSCSKCGEIIKCPDCQIALTYHQETNSLMCHHCGYVQEMISVCPVCHRGKLYKRGFGTERVQNEIKKLFPSSKILRLDSDVSKRKGGIESTLNKFKNHEADILIGTQLVSKGHDFPLVSLVGVVLADISLSLPSFKANEMTFSLLTQTIGRAGRDKEGKAIIQTYLKDNKIIHFAKDQDYESFFIYEMKQRHLLNNPPYSNLISLLFSSSSEEKAEETANRVKNDLLTKVPLDRVTILGPSKLFINKFLNNYRRRLLIQYKDRKDIEPYIESLVRSFSLIRDIKLTIDVDPTSDY